MQQTTPPRYDSIDPVDWDMIVRISRRACQIVADFKRNNRCDDLLDPDRMLIMMDIATVHVCRPLALLAWMLSDDLSFFEEFTTITKNIDRTCARFPDHVRLRFAKS